jgi:hypothetical protein
MQCYKPKTTHHRNEDSARRHNSQVASFEVEFRQMPHDSALDAHNLLRNHRQNLKVDAVELVKASLRESKSCLCRVATFELDSPKHRN